MILKYKIDDINTDFLYTAFISYRHSELDRKWAKWLFYKLETFRIPKALSKGKKKRRLGKIYRDENEFSAAPNLHDHIRSALERSECLIVICSKNTPQSRWVGEEIEYFRSLGRGNRIFALLIEGEPADSFPLELRELSRLQTLEPVAADVRERNNQKLRRTKKQALLRIVSAILECSYDDLYRRERRRQIAQKSFLIGVVLLAMFLLIGGYALTQKQISETRRLETVRSLDEKSTLLIGISNVATAYNDTTSALAVNLEAFNHQKSLRGARKFSTANTLAKMLDLEHVNTLVNPLKLDGHESYMDFLDSAIARNTNIDYFSEDLKASYLSQGNQEDNTRAALVLRPNENFDPIIRWAMSPSARFICIAYELEGTLKVWDLKTREPVLDLIGHGEEATALYQLTISSVAYSSDGSKILTSSFDETARVWDSATGEELAVLKGHGPQASVNVARFSDDDDYIITGGGDGTAKVWSAETYEIIYTLSGHTEPVSDARFSPDGTNIVTGSFDKTVRIWNAQNGNLMHVFNGHDSDVEYVSFSSDGRSVISLDDKNNILLWRVPPVLEMAVSPEGKSNREWPSPHNPNKEFDRSSTLVLSADSENVVHILKVSDGSHLGALTGHTDVVNSAKFNKGGTLVITASDDGTAILWDAASESRIYLFKNDDIDITYAEFSEDGMSINLLGRTKYLYRHSVVQNASGEFPLPYLLLEGIQADAIEAKPETYREDWIHAAAAKSISYCLTPAQRKEYYLPPDPPCWCQEKSFPPMSDWEDDYIIRNPNPDKDINGGKRPVEETKPNPFKDMRDDGWKCPHKGEGYSAPWNEFDDLRTVTAFEILGPASRVIPNPKQIKVNQNP